MHCPLIFDGTKEQAALLHARALLGLLAALGREACGGVAAAAFDGTSSTALLVDAGDAAALAAGGAHLAAPKLYNEAQARRPQPRLGAAPRSAARSQCRIRLLCHSAFPAPTHLPHGLCRGLTYLCQGPGVPYS